MILSYKIYKTYWFCNHVYPSERWFISWCLTQKNIIIYDVLPLLYILCLYIVSRLLIRISLISQVYIFIYLQIICLHHPLCPIFTWKKQHWFLGDCLLFILQLQANLLSWNLLHFVSTKPKSITCVNQFHFLYREFWSDSTLVLDTLPFPLGIFYI